MKIESEKIYGTVLKTYKVLVRQVVYLQKLVKSERTTNETLQ